MSNRKSSKDAELVEYEKQRLKTIAANDARLEAIGLPATLRGMTMDRDKGRKERKRRSKDDDYVPGEDDDNDVNDEDLVDRPSRNTAVITSKKQLAFTPAMDRRRGRSSAHHVTQPAPATTPQPAPATTPQPAPATTPEPAPATTPATPGSSPYTPPSSSGSSTSTRRRGPTTLTQVWDRCYQKKVEVNEIGEMVGDVAVELSSFLGSLARRSDIIPVMDCDWRKLPESVKEAAWNEIWLRYNFPDKEHARKARLQQLAVIWRNYKADLHFGWKSRRGTPLEFVPCYTECPVDQYLGMISIWKEESFKKKSQQNAENKSHQEYSHALGRRSMCNHEQLERKKKGSSEPLMRRDLFITSRTRKDGTPVNAAAKEKIDKLVELAATGTPDNYGPNDHLSMVLGPEKPGRVRCFPGCSPRGPWRSAGASSSSGGTISQDQLSEAVSRARQAEEGLKRMHDIMSLMATQLSGPMQTQIEAMLVAERSTLYASPGRDVGSIEGSVGCEEEDAENEGGEDGDGDDDDAPIL